MHKNTYFSFDKRYKNFYVKILMLKHFTAMTKYKFLFCFIWLQVTNLHRTVEQILFEKN